MRGSWRTIWKIRFERRSAGWAQFPVSLPPRWKTAKGPSISFFMTTCRWYWASAWRAIGTKNGYWASSVGLRASLWCDWQHLIRTSRFGRPVMWPLHLSCREALQISGGTCFQSKPITKKRVQAAGGRGVPLWESYLKGPCPLAVSVRSGGSLSSRTNLTEKDIRLSKFWTWDGRTPALSSIFWFEMIKRI